MRKSKELLLLRYLSFFILIIQMFSNEVKVKGLIFILLFLINNNIRLFYLKSDLKISLSIIIEFLCIPIACLNLGGNIIFCLIGIVIDVFSLKNKIIKNIFIFIILVMSISPILAKGTENGIINLLVIGVLFILLNYIQKLYDTKLKSQKLYDKLRISEEKLIEANEELEGYLISIEELTLLKERNRISREIHDSVGHALSTAMIQLSAMEAVAKKENSTLEIMAKNLRDFINESFQDVKRAVREIKPEEYHSYEGVFRIQEVCRNFEKMTGVKIKETISKGDWGLNSKQTSYLYRITQEILSNSLRHGKADRIRVIMNFTEDEFIISFKDNGIGIENIEEKGLGLKNIRERSEELGGSVFMESKLNEGFFVKIIVPREREV